MFVPGGVVEVFRVADDVQPELEGPGELGVVRVGVHADDGVDVGVQALRVPPHLLGEESSGGQSASAWVVNGVVGPCDGVALVVQGEGEVVHGSTPDGDEVDVHEAEWVKRAAAVVHGMGPRNAARNTPKKGTARRAENTAPMPRSRARSDQPRRMEVRQSRPSCS